SVASACGCSASSPCSAPRCAPRACRRRSPRAACDRHPLRAPGAALPTPVPGGSPRRNPSAPERIHATMRRTRRNEKTMRTVLVIDDNPAVGTALDLLFGLREIRTLVARDPLEGLETLSREDVDV